MRHSLALLHYSQLRANGLKFLIKGRTQSSTMLPESIAIRLVLPVPDVVKTLSIQRLALSSLIRRKLPAQETSHRPRGCAALCAIKRESLKSLASHSRSMSTGWLPCPILSVLVMHLFHCVSTRVSSGCISNDSGGSSHSLLPSRNYEAPGNAVNQSPSPLPRPPPLYSRCRGKLRSPCASFQALTSPKPGHHHQSTEHLTRPGAWMLDASRLKLRLAVV